MRLAVVMITLLGTTAGVPNQATGAQSRQQRETVHLRFVSVPDYAFGIAGDQWGKFVRVTVTLRANRTVERVAVAATTTGSFLVGVSAADLCVTTSVEARGEAHHRVVLRGPPKPCLVILESSPRLTILRGRHIPLPGQQA